VVLFQGEVNQTITLRAKADKVLEGDEKFTISLVSADNNADINPKMSEARIFILADKGANGIMQIMSKDRAILIGEPSASYDGKAKIGVTRGIGKFGEVKITWQITERDTETFLALQGMVTFKDGQENQIIEIQVSKIVYLYTGKLFVCLCHSSFTVNYMAISNCCQLWLKLFVFVSHFRGVFQKF
jgi:G-protein coupled receptor 98